MCSGQSNGVARYTILESAHMYLVPRILIVEVHITFDVVISAERVMSSEGHFIRFSPAVILTRFGSFFLGSIIRHNLRIHYHVVFWNGLHFVQIHE